MSDPRTAPYGSVRLADVDTLAQVDPGNPDINDCAFHLVRRHFDVQAFGVNAATGNAGDEMIEEHHEADDEENQTNGHEELFAVMTGHAVFTVDGEEIDAPAGTIVFVRDPALLRPARATADGTAIFMVGGPAGEPVHRLALGSSAPVTELTEARDAANARPVTTASTLATAVPASGGSQSRGRSKRSARLAAGCHCQIPASPLSPTGR